MTRWIIRAAVSAVVIALLVTFIPVGSVVDALRRTNPWVWTLSLLVFLAGHAINAMKWRLLLGAPAAARRDVPAGALRRTSGQPRSAGRRRRRPGASRVRGAVARDGARGPGQRGRSTRGHRRPVVVIAFALPLAGTPPRSKERCQQRPMARRAGGAGAVLVTVLVWLRPHEATARQIDRAIQLARTPRRPRRRRPALGRCIPPS